MATEILPVASPGTNSDEPIASTWHTLMVLAIAGLNAYRAVIQAAHVREGMIPSRPSMYLRAMVFEGVLLLTVAGGVRLRGASLRSLFGERWRSLSEVARDLGLGLVLLVGSVLVGSILGGHQREAAPDQSIGYLLPHGTLELLLWMAVSVTAGVCEEAVYRGYFQRQFTAFMHSAPMGIVLSAVVFAGVHAYQGWQRALVIGVSAVLFGAVAYWRGTVRPGMFAHALQDGTAPLLIRLMQR